MGVLHTGVYVVLFWYILPYTMLVYSWIHLFHTVFRITVLNLEILNKSANEH